MALEQMNHWALGKQIHQSTKPQKTAGGGGITASRSL